MKIFLNFMIISFFATQAYAGFWSSALGTAAGGAMSGGNKNVYNGVDATESPKRIQQTLSKLGFYNTKFDGNLNSFDTRSAIEEFQNYYNLKESGILSEIQKQDLLYMHDLLKNYKLEIQNPKDKNSKRLKKIFKAFDKLEKKISNNKLSNQYLSVKFKKEVKDRRIYLKEEKQKKIEQLNYSIVGIWSYKNTISVYNKGGMYFAKIFKDKTRKDLVMEAEGKWWIKNNQLYNTIHKITPKSIQVPNEVYIDKIVSIDNNYLIFIDSKNKKIKKYRVD